MPIPGLTSLAVTVTRLAYRLAERKRWLPGGAFHRRSMDSLRSGDLDEAERLNRLALERKPRHDKAQVVRDLIAMRRDAVTGDLHRRLDAETDRIRKLEQERTACSRTLARIEKRRRRARIGAWLLVPLSAAGALGAGMVAGGAAYPLWARITAGVVGTGIIVALVISRFIGSRADELVQEQECRAALETLARELGTRRRRTAELQRQLKESTRHDEQGP
jgi:hypothetical protein